jgi:hypothetical protein
MKEKPFGYAVSVSSYVTTDILKPQTSLQIQSMRQKRGLVSYLGVTDETDCGFYYHAMVEDSRIQLKRLIFSSSADTMSDLRAEGNFSTYFLGILHGHSP